MAGVSTHNSDTLYNTSVVDILSWFGKRVDHRNYMFFSPFREENEPSMRVTVNPVDGTWVWADYGGSSISGKKVDGGGCLDLVQRLGGYSSRAEAYALLSRIASAGGRTVVASDNNMVRTRECKRSSGIVIDSVGPFKRRVLLDYAEGRGFSKELLSRYCRQVRFHSVANPSKSYVWIGFRNNSDGFALRGTGGPKFSKKNNVSDITTIGPDGLHLKDGSVAAERCVMFESWSDFLSYLAWRGVVEPGVDVCVLNSTSLLGRARTWMESHRFVRTFFDNDGAGDKASELAKLWCKKKGLDYKDGRMAYSKYDDLNEAYVSEVVCKDRSNRPGGNTIGK